jgi:hypothetical protein
MIQAPLLLNKSYYLSPALEVAKFIKVKRYDFGHTFSLDKQAYAVWAQVGFLPHRQTRQNILTTNTLVYNVAESKITKSVCFELPCSFFVTLTIGIIIRMSLDLM